jgi:hydrogenase expression/formation protein HypC
MCLGIPGEIVRITDAETNLATVDVGGVRRVVNVGLLDDVTPGDWVLVHVGFAMSKIDEVEAQATLAMLAGLGQAYTDELTALRTSDPT